MHFSIRETHDPKGTCHEQVDNQGPSGTQLQTSQEPVLQLAQAQANRRHRYHPEVTTTLGYNPDNNVVGIDFFIFGV